MSQIKKERFAFIKPYSDVHTLGVNSIAELLKDCGYEVIVGDEHIENTVNDIRFESNQKELVKWINAHRITHIGISYRLDEDIAVSIVGHLIKTLRDNQLLAYQGGPIGTILYGGLPKACDLIEKEHRGLVKTFKGGESISETLSKLEVPKERIPHYLVEGSAYDDFRMAFGEDVINKSNYDQFKPLDRSDYPEYGTREDTVVKRLQNTPEGQEFSPLMRAHVGPFLSNESREESVKAFANWTKYLAETGCLDIISIGTSQLTQSSFGENWEDRVNGGGVPINSPEEYRMIYDVSRPLLLRTYAGTKNIPELAAIHEDTINISWHALSLWWFNKLDERGPYSLYESLKQHFETIKYIATTGKPFEANVAHHFAFRGGDDVTYVVSAYLAAKLAKKLGIKTHILQNMLNTPRATWGIADLAKSRALLTLVNELEDDNYEVILQPRAGLDYFKSDLDEAKIQLAAVSALMDDIDPHNEMSPPIVHVVSYSEASHLATPDIINESVQITQQAIKEYRKLRKNGDIEDMSQNPEVKARTEEVLQSARTIIKGIETHIDNPYTPEGFYKIFAAGFLPVPYLWSNDEEYRFAKHFKTRPIKGSTKVVDEEGNPVKAQEVVDFARSNLKEVDYVLKSKYLNKIELP
ncbi:hypothetical protein GCM10008932_19130 [Alkalibacterium iburiense]|uniref:Cobalamin-binding protein n=1 Tax=Alkalibacterium iburiense TaxID=290589 RepID=A0ABN0XLK8_9LACT